MRTPILALASLLLGTCSLAAQLTPPTILKGTAPGGDVRSMSNNQNSLASLADGSVSSLIYRQTSPTAGGELVVAITFDDGQNWTYHPLPQSTGHLVHDPESGTLCAGRKCDILHVAWSDRSRAGAGFIAYYATLNTGTKQWSTPVQLAAGANANEPVTVRDITCTPLGTIAVALAVGPNGGLGMGPDECGLIVRRPGQPFGVVRPMRAGGLRLSRQASIVAIDEVVHCAFKNLKGAGGIAYRSFDTEALAWQQPTQVMVGPNDNGVAGLNGINAGEKAVIAKDTQGGLYILYPSGSAGGLSNNNKLRMAYAKPGTGSLNADWTDLEVLDHTTAVGANPRGASAGDPDYPALQAGDAVGTWYTLAPGFQGSMLVVYSKPWEDFQNKYLQIWQYGVNFPLPSKEIQFWPDTEPYVFERMSGMRSTSSVGQAAWVVYGKNDQPTPGQAPNGWVRLWAATDSTGRTISFGTGCRGSLPEIPKMAADEQFAMLGQPYIVEFSGFPANAFYYLAVGTKCETLDLTGLGAAGCELNIDFPVVVRQQVTSAGVRSLRWFVPNDRNLIGRFFYSQAFVLSPGANPAGVVTSNAIRTSISQ